MPLTDLLKKDGFQWDNAATNAFSILKGKMSLSPVLALLDFEKPFEIESDAANSGIVDVIQQNRHLISFISKKLVPRRQIQEKKLLAIVFAV